MRNTAAELLFLLSRQHGHERGTFEKLLADFRDWPRFTTLMRDHECAPLVYASWKKLALGALIPPAVIDGAKDIYYAHLRRNLLLENEMHAICTRAAARNADILAFKGFALIQSTYRDPGLRPMADIDLLVSELHLKAAHSALEESGYTAHTPRHNDEERGYTKNGSGSQGFIIELHTRLFPPRPYELRLPVRERARKIMIRDTPVFIPSPEDSFLIAALHIRRHTRRLTLKFVVDINELLSSGEQLDWDYITRQAKENKSVNCVALALYLSSCLFNSRSGPVPPASPLFRGLAAGLLNRENFLENNRWRGYALRAILFDSIRDAALYACRSSQKKEPSEPV